MKATKTSASLIALLLIASSASASTLVALRSAKSVVLAADSKMSPFYKPSPLPPLAKIVRCGPYFAGFAGVRVVNTNDVHFNVKETIAKACMSQQTPQEATQAISDAAKSDYIKVYTALTTTDPDYMHSITSGAKTLMRADIILVGTDAGIPFIATILLLPRLQDRTVVIEPVISMYNDKLQPGVCDYAFGGIYGDLWDLLATKDKQISAGNLLADAGFLVDYQINKTPDVSGYPINVVEITAAGEVNVKHCESVCEWKH